MKKAFLKQIPFLLLLLTIVFSCQNDDDLEDNTNLQTNSKVLAKRVTLNEIKENSQLRQSITKIENQFDYIKRNNVNSKINSTDNSFAILTDEILQVTTDSTEAFTFRIEIPTHTDSSFENFVIEKQNENEYEFYIYRYKLLELEGNIEVTHSISKESVSAEQISLGDFQDILNAKMVYDEGSGCLFDITYNDGCTCEYAEVFWCPESSGGGGGSGSSGSGSGSTGGSTGSGSGSTGGSTGSGSTGGSTGGGYGGSTGGGGYNGGSGGPNPGSGVGGSTIGVLPSLNSQIIKQFFINLDQDQKDCLNSNLDVKSDVTEFLDNNLGPIDVNGTSPFAPNTPQEIAESIIDVICSSSDPDLTFEDVTTLTIASFDTPKIENITEELECFDLSAPARMTIYCEQSISGSRVLTGNIGHTFIGLEQNGVVRNIGFYPDFPEATLVGSQDSELHDNSNSPFHVSISVDITAVQLQQTVTSMINYPSSYSLNSYNCTDFGIVIAGLGGLTLPETIGEYSGYGGLVKFKGRNPSDLGEDMRELTLPTGVNASRNLLSGNAPLRSADCP